MPLTTTNASTVATPGAISRDLLGRSAVVAIAAGATVTKGYPRPSQQDRVQTVDAEAPQSAADSRSRTSWHSPPSFPRRPPRRFPPEPTTGAWGAWGSTLRLVVRLAALSMVLTGTTGFSSPSSSLPTGQKQSQRMWFGFVMNCAVDRHVRRDDG